MPLAILAAVLAATLLAKAVSRTQGGRLKMIARPA